MRKLVYYIGVSIDGRIAGPHGESDFFPMGDESQIAEYMDWVNIRYPETVPSALRPQVGLEDSPNLRFDTVIMGWNTYDVAAQQGIDSPYDHLRQYVVTRNHGGSAAVAEAGAGGAGSEQSAQSEQAEPTAQPADSARPAPRDVTFTDDARALVRTLKQRDGLDIWLCGGGLLAGALLDELDELIIKRYPVIAGAGPVLADGDFAPTAFTGEPPHTFANGVTVTRYTRAPG